MQQSDDQRRTSRPSLLSEQPSGGESQSILSKLDGRGAPAKVKRSSAQQGRKPGVIAAVAAVLLAGGGTLAWLLQDGASEQQVVAAPVVAAPAATAPAVATPVAATAAAAPPPLVLAEGPRTPAPAPEAEPEVSAATILEDVPDAKDELATLLNKPAAPQAKEDKPRTVAAKDEEPAKPAARKKTEAVKVARKDKSPAKEKKTAVAAAPKKKPAPKAEPSVDSDVALLAALLAHSKANAAPKVSKTAAEYKRCGTLGSVAEADKCRERLCEANSKAKAECKTLRVAKVSS